MCVLAVGEETGTREGVDDSRLPFLGRDDETATVRRALSGAWGREESSPSTARPGWASPASPTRHSTP